MLFVYYSIIKVEEGGKEKMGNGQHVREEREAKEGSIKLSRP